MYSIPGFVQICNGIDHELTARRGVDHELSVVPVEYLNIKVSFSFFYQINNEQERFTVVFIVTSATNHI